MAFRFFRKKKLHDETAQTTISGTQSDEVLLTFAQALEQETSGLGLEAAQLRGVLEDGVAQAAAQASALQALIEKLADISAFQSNIQRQTTDSMATVGLVQQSLNHLGHEVAKLTASLKEVADAAEQITQVALQTRLVAFNATVEAKRAGEAGRGFSVVADAVKDLATQVENSSKTITQTVNALNTRVLSVENDIQRTPEDGHQDGIQAALRSVETGVSRICQSAADSMGLSANLTESSQSMAHEAQQTRQALDTAVTRSENVLSVSERLMQRIAACGVETTDTPYIQLAQEIAGNLAEALSKAVSTGRIQASALFDEQYKPVLGSNPQQHLTGFNAITDEYFPPIQEPALVRLPNIVFCIGVDRNGYIPTHNQQYCQLQRSGDVAWNTAHCRWRRIFNDRTGLASARNTQPFLLQTYRRDMGGGIHVLLKEVAAPITVHGRHWGGLRLAYKGWA